ncbi:conserved Plasmodium protein, unknown function [Plasmodium ovale wallikeri]|uniref:Uncharacterized protein n=1 Tax=Plasmodium ovale wallikeri TaxID=864142 RepID=A0A1A8YTN7_PLAOA|nr:conserved Plasmodium protein, unknown function [Plasmodium ovale wallikeri]
MQARKHANTLTRKHIDNNRKLTKVFPPSLPLVNEKKKNSTHAEWSDDKINREAEMEKMRLVFLITGCSNGVYLCRYAADYTHRSVQHGCLVSHHGTHAYIEKHIPLVGYFLTLQCISPLFFFFFFLTQKFCEEIILNLSDITKIRQLTQKRQNKTLEKENVKKIFLHGIFSSINFKTLNSISYLLGQFDVERATICSVLNEVSEDVHEVKHAENFLALHFFLLKDEDVAGKKKKKKVHKWTRGETLRTGNILHIVHLSPDALPFSFLQIGRIYEECVNDLMRRKIERYNLYCERKKIQFRVGDALKKLELNVKEDDLYFSYDYKDLLKIFERRIGEVARSRKGNDILGEDRSLHVQRNAEDIAMENAGEIAGGSESIRMDDSSRDRIGKVPGGSARGSPGESSDESIDVENNENLKELKKTYEEVQSFNDSIIRFIDTNQRLYYFDDNEYEFSKRGKKEYSSLENQGEEADEEDIARMEGTTDVGEEDVVAMKKSVDEYIQKFTRENNASVDQLKNLFIEQADINFKKFLNNLNLDNVRKENEGKKTELNTGEEAKLDAEEKTKLDAGGEIVEDLHQSNEITNFCLKQLNKSDEEFNLTNDIMYERLRVKVLYYIQKIEYLKFKYQYDIINERYPINKNEKTILDILKYGYRIVVSPDVDNSIFHKGLEGERTGWKTESAGGAPSHKISKINPFVPMLLRRVICTYYHRYTCTRRLLFACTLFQDAFFVPFPNFPHFPFFTEKYYDFKCRECDYHIFDAGMELQDVSDRDGDGDQDRDLFPVHSHEYMPLRITPLSFLFTFLGDSDLSEQMKECPQCNTKI